MIDGALFYTAIRLTLGIVNAVCWTIIFRRSIPSVKQLRSVSAERRLRMVTITFGLALFSITVLVGLIVSLGDPPPSSTFLAALRIAASAILAFIGAVLVWTNTNEDET